MTVPRKLIEVALPLDAINAACKADKDRKTGTIRNLHKWFAPMPLPAWRALLFASLIDDPDDDVERDRLMLLVERLVENGSDLPSPEVMTSVRREIAESWPDGTPVVLDCFCGGASTLVAAQDLGLSTVASDLNPIPVLLAEVLTVLAPEESNRPSLYAPSNGLIESSGFDGLRSDVVAVAKLVRERALAEVAKLYGSQVDEAVAWFWVRTTPCPNPACGIHTPLATTWWLQKKPGARSWIEVSASGTSCTYTVIQGQDGEAPTAPKVGKAAFACVQCGHVIREKELREIGQQHRFGLDLMAVAFRTPRGRAFRSPTDEDLRLSQTAEGDEGVQHVAIHADGLGVRVGNYGLDTIGDLFTQRQQSALAAIADAVASASASAELPDGGPDGARRRRSVAAILGLSLGKLAQFNSDQVHWKIDSRNGTGKPESAFGQAILPMSWDFVETNPFGGTVGDWMQVVDTALRGVAPGVRTAGGKGQTAYCDARNASNLVPPQSALVACDPPYFGQIGYADLSDYFYYWIRRALKPEFSELFATMAAPRSGELVASPDRHGGDGSAATDYFVEGFREVFSGLRKAQHAEIPLLIMYASREQERIGDAGPSSWEAMLDAVFRSGLSVVGTWPIRATGSTRVRSQGSNALASYVALACRPRRNDAPRISAQDFSRVLRTELEPAVVTLQRASIAPVDLAQAMIGPGVAVFSRNSSVLKTDGSNVTVREALSAINRTLGVILDEQEGDLDPDSRWAAAWYEQHGFSSASFGEADQLARAKGISVDALVHAGIVESGANRVRLLPREDLLDDWDPRTDRRPTAWEGVQYLVRALRSGGEAGAAHLFSRMGTITESSRELAYRLFQLAEKTGRTEEAIAYNDLVGSWSEIARLAKSVLDQVDPDPSAGSLF